MTNGDLAAVMAENARAWLGSLNAAQRAQAMCPWPSDEERHRWYYTPTDHGGLSLTQMRPGQQGLAMRLLASGLSDPGYVTVSTIIGLENVLDKADGWEVDWGRARGRDPQQYWLRVFGDPHEAGTRGPWSWRFGGHHVSVQHLILDGAVQASTPCFLGADPASSPLLGGLFLRPLGATEDLAGELVRSLDGEQAARAVLAPVAPVDLVTGNRPKIVDGDDVMPLGELWRSRFTSPRLRDSVEAVHEMAEVRAGTRPEHREAVRYSSQPKGIPASWLSANQQTVLRRLLGTFIDRVPRSLAEREAEKYAGKRFDGVHFAWAGSQEPGQPHYFRLQAPGLLAEWDNTQRNGNHVHSVWRDPDNDFGDDVLARHLAQFH
ncbi:DUF3500 domain-containing protein [Kineosporia sp. NBRC 101677]|uniref:DUF3500 domain-containing protein n=1 Tax=Kineosporia sp. NBRC 101677 TaxID=3032197 RepID=UPI002555AF68|nr:DUF3500 domain-containing protein [Kineosporia sp. NBRC 101677]